MEINNEKSTFKSSELDHLFEWIWVSNKGKLPKKSGEKELCLIRLLNEQLADFKQNNDYILFCEIDKSTSNSRIKFKKWANRKLESYYIGNQTNIPTFENYLMLYGIAEKTIPGFNIKKIDFKSKGKNITTNFDYYYQTKLVVAAIEEYHQELILTLKGEII